MSYDEECGHHCPSDCPRCGEENSRPKKRRKVAATKVPRKSAVRRRWCACEGSDHNHGCPNGM